MTVFGGNDGALDLTVSGGTKPYTYLWNTGATNEDLKDLTAGTYSVTITDSKGCITTADATVNEPNISQKPDLEITNVPDKTIYSKEGEIIEYTITVKNTGNLVLTDVEVSCDANDFYSLTEDEFAPNEQKFFKVNYAVTLDDLFATKIENVAKVTAVASVTGEIIKRKAVAVTNFKCEQFSRRSIKIPELITPNGDNINDVWEIDNLVNATICNGGNDKNLVNKVMIFNRWGIKVYEKANYMLDQERFDGVSELNDNLPDGTYFYILELKREDDKPISIVGYLYIVRGAENR